MLEINLVLAPFWVTYQPPLGISALKAYLEKNGFKVKCHDLNIKFYNEYYEANKEIFTNENFTDKNNFDENVKPLLIEFYKKWLKENSLSKVLVGFSIFDSTLFASLELVKLIKNDENKIVFGGPITNLSFLEEIDIFIKGEGEETFLEIAKEIPLKKIKGIIYNNGEIIHNEERPLIKNLDLIPAPDFSDFEIKEYSPNKDDSKAVHLPIMASRGCIGQCTYCSEKAFWKFYRQKSPEVVLKEMNDYSEKYDTIEFIFADSLFNANLKMLSDFCDLLIKNDKKYFWGGMARFHKDMDLSFFKKLRKSGCIHIEFGLETGSQRLIDEIKKNIKIEDAENNLRDAKKAGIATNIFIMPGYPTEEEKDFEETLEFIDKNHKNIFAIYYSERFGISKGTYVSKHLDEFNIKFYENGEWYNDIVTPEINKKRNDILIKYINKYKLEPKDYHLVLNFNKNMEWDRNLKFKRILIELTDNCNLNCKMCCNRDSPHGISKGFIDLNLYKKILNEIDLSKEWSLELFWLGESMLHPQFDEIIDFTYDKIINSKSHVNLHTNAELLNEKRINQILRFGHKFPWITFSIDAARPETHQKIRKGDLDLIKKNISNFILNRKSIFPQINLQLIVMKENKDEVLEFVEEWEKFYKENKIISNDNIYLKRIELHDIKKQEESNKIYDEIIEKYNLFSRRSQTLSIRSKEKEGGKEGYWFENKKRKACSSPFKNPVIRWDGEVTVCCFDDIYFYSMGNLKEKSFNEIWYGDEMDEFREKHILGKFGELIGKDDFKKCEQCIGYYFPTISDEELKLYSNFKKI